MVNQINSILFYFGCEGGRKIHLLIPIWVTDVEENEKFGDMFENVAPVKAEDWSVTRS